MFLKLIMVSTIVILYFSQNIIKIAVEFLVKSVRLQIFLRKITTLLYQISANYREKLCYSSISQAIH